MFVRKSTMELALRGKKISYESLERDRNRLKTWKDTVIQDRDELHKEFDKLTKKLQQVQLDHALEICPLGTKFKHIGLDITVVRLEVSQEGDVAVVGDFNKDGDVQEIVLSLELVKTLKP